MPGFIIFVLFLLLVAGFIVISSLYVVKQQSVAIIERFGRYQKISDSGIHMRAPFGIDKIAARVQLRVLQSEIVVETKTQDNVFVTMNVATQYRVNESNVKDAYYKLMRPESLRNWQKQTRSRSLLLPKLRRKKTACTGSVLPSNGRLLSMDWQTLLKS